jgi:hypothetical protein
MAKETLLSPSFRELPIIEVRLKILPKAGDIDTVEDNTSRDGIRHDGLHIDLSFCRRYSQFLESPEKPFLVIAEALVD